MSIEFVDRVSAYPNRYLVTPENGTPYYVTLERADEPTTMGTPLNAATLNQLIARNDLDVLPDMYLWKKYAADPSTILTEEVVDVTLSSKMSVYGSKFSAVRYGTGYYAERGELKLSGSITNQHDPSTSSLTSTLGKYILMNSTTVYYIPEDATFTQTSVSTYGSTYYYLKVDNATKYSIPRCFGFVMDAVEDKYPVNGVFEDDGYWYVYGHKWGECAGSVSVEEISAAVNEYLDANPVECNVSMSDVNAAIDAKIGSAIGGSY